MPMIEFEVPVVAPSVANTREHWSVKSKRTKAHRGAAYTRCPSWKAGPLLVVRLTRCAPRALDTDNLASALKAVRDGVASRLRIDDASPLVRWDYAQEKAEKGAECVRVEVLSPGEAAERETELTAQQYDATLKSWAEGMR